MTFWVLNVSENNFLHNHFYCSCFQSCVRHGERALWGPLISSPVQIEFLFSYSTSFTVPRFYRTGPVGVLILLSVQSVCSWFVLREKHLAVRCLLGSFWTVSHGIFVYIDNSMVFSVLSLLWCPDGVVSVTGMIISFTNSACFRKIFASWW